MLDELEQLLAQLYSTSKQARHVVDRMGVPAARIDLDGAMRDVWHGIVTEVVNRRQLLDLVRIATEDFPNQASLQGMLRALDYAASEKALQESYRAGDESPPPRHKGYPMSSRYEQGDDNYSPRIGERVARLEEKTETLRTSMNDGFAHVNDRLDDITAAISARPNGSATEKRVERIVVGIGIGFAVLVILLLSVWLRLSTVVNWEALLR